MVLAVSLCGPGRRYALQAVAARRGSTCTSSQVELFSKLRNPVRSAPFPSLVESFGDPNTGSSATQLIHGLIS